MQCLPCATPLLVSLLPLALPHARQRTPAIPRPPPPPLLAPQMVTYGLRGLAAYTHHAEVLGQRDPEVRCIDLSCWAGLIGCELVWMQQCVAVHISVLYDRTAFPDPPLTAAQVDKFVAKAYAFLCSEDALDLGKVGGGGYKGY